MDLVVKKVWNRTVVSSHTVDGPLSTNHELTQDSHEKSFGVATEFLKVLEMVQMKSKPFIWNTKLIMVVLILWKHCYY